MTNALRALVNQTYYLIEKSCPVPTLVCCVFVFGKYFKAYLDMLTNGIICELDKIHFTLHTHIYIYIYYKIVCQSKPLMDKSKWLLEQDC